MAERYIYLAGPITGCTENEAKDWRQMAKDTLTHISPNLIGVSPLRCEPCIGETYSSSYEDPRFGTEKAISAKNWFDTKMADMVLAYLPRVKFEEGMRESMGTILEIGWASGKDIPVITVTDEPHYIENVVLNGQCSKWVFQSFEPAFDVIEGILGVYAK